MADRLQFYYRDGCHLCEEMAAMLYRGWPDRFGRMQWCDVDTCDEWRSTYGHRVPVLVYRDEMLCEFHLVPEAVIPHFGPPAIPL